MNKYDLFITTVTELVNAAAAAKGKDQQYKLLQMQMYIRGFSEANQTKETSQ